MLKTTNFLIAVALFLHGCASPARMEQMAARNTTVAPVEFALKHKVAVRHVGGGETTNPMWVSKVGNDQYKSALEQSLRSASILVANQEDAEYVLDANLLSLDQPFVGFDLTVTSSVEYALEKKSNGDKIFLKLIQTPFTATVSDAFLAVERLRIANEGSVRKNIEAVIDDLYRLQPATSRPAATDEAKHKKLTELKADFESGAISRDEYKKRQLEILK